MKIVPFPLCCGAFIMTDFGNTISTSGTGRSIPPREIEFFVKMVVDRYHAAFVMAIVNEDQNEVCEEIFEDNGFKFIEKSYNPGHDGHCYLYVRS